MLKGSGGKTSDFIVKMKSYGSTDGSTGDTALIYCIHGRPPKQCCDENAPDGGGGGVGFSITPTEVTNMGEHCHKPRKEGVDKIARRKLIIASILCVVFIIVEVVGGVLSNSLAIATDAAHLLTDFASFMISLLALWMAGRQSTGKFSFGWYRAEVLGALISVVMIWVITAILVFLAIGRIINQDFEVNATVMLITSGFAILVNVIMGFSLHSHGHSHGGGGGSGGHSHVHHEEENINVRAAFIHVIGDVLQSIGVFVAALLIYFFPSWYLADPICTFVFSVIVLLTTFRILKDTTMVLMEATPNYLDYKEVMNTFLAIDGVVRVHNLRIWALSINKVALGAHLAIRPDANPEGILKIATECVHEKYKFFETTIQIEFFHPEMEDCNQCSNPE